MRFLADENVPGPAVAALRREGIDVAWVAEDSPGASDEEVLQRSAGESRTLLTLDKDFGELVFRQGQPAGPGVLLVRIDAESPEEIASILGAALKTARDWSGCFSVVNRNRIRMTPLPRARSSAG